MSNLICKGGNIGYPVASESEWCFDRSAFGQNVVSHAGVESRFQRCETKVGIELVGRMDVGRRDIEESSDSFPSQCEHLGIRIREVRTKRGIIHLIA